MLCHRGHFLACLHCCYNTAHLKACTASQNVLNLVFFLLVVWRQAPGSHLLVWNPCKVILHHKFMQWQGKLGTHSAQRASEKLVEALRVLSEGLLQIRFGFGQISKQLLLASFTLLKIGERDEIDTCSLTHSDRGSWREKPAPFQHLGRRKLRAALKTARLNWRGGERVLYPHIHLKDLSKISSRKGSQVWFEDLKVNNPISLSPRSIYLINLTISSSSSCNVSLLHLSSWCFYLMLTWLMSDLW